MRERLAKLDLVSDNYRAQQAEGLITMTNLRERLDELAGERRDLEARVARLRNAEQRLRELEELPNLVEEYLADLPDLMDKMPQAKLREYEVVPPEGTGRLEPFILTPENIRYKDEAELEADRRRCEAERGAAFRELYGMLGLRAAVSADGTVEITVDATDTKEVMPWDESSSPSTIYTRT